MAKIVQIASWGGGIAALRDDGSLWVYDSTTSPEWGGGYSWNRLCDIPEEDK